MYLINFLKSYFEWNPFILNGTNRSYSTERRVASRSAMSLHVMYKLSVHSLIHIYFSLLICLASSLPYCYFSQLLFFFSLFYHALSLSPSFYFSSSNHRQHSYLCILYHQLPLPLSQISIYLLFSVPKSLFLYVIVYLSVPSSFHA